MCFGCSKEPSHTNGSYAYIQHVLVEKKIWGLAHKSVCRARIHVERVMILIWQGSLTLAMGKCLWLSVKIKVCQSALSSH